MACKGTHVTKKEQYRMWALYQDLGSFKLVAKRVRRHPDTVSKYVKIYEAAQNVANLLR